MVFLITIIDTNDTPVVTPVRCLWFAVLVRLIQRVLFNGVAAVRRCVPADRLRTILEILFSIGTAVRTVEGVRNNISQKYIKTNTGAQVNATCIENVPNIHCALPVRVHDDDTLQDRSWTRTRARQTLTVSIQTAGPFVLQGGSSVLQRWTIVATRAFDYEVQTQYTVDVTIKDNGEPEAHTTTRMFIFVQNVDEAPAEVTLSKDTVVECSSSSSTTIGTEVGVLTSYDEDFHTPAEIGLVNQDTSFFDAKVMGCQAVQGDESSCVHCLPHKIYLLCRSKLFLKKTIKFTDGNPQHISVVYGNATTQPRWPFKVTIINVNEAPTRTCNPSCCIRMPRFSCL